MSRRTLVIALGVKGLLRRSRLSFVVWDLRRREASRRTWRGFGGSGWDVLVVGVGEVRVAR